MDIVNTGNEENIGSSLFRVKRVKEKNASNVRKKSFKMDGSRNKPKKSVRHALMDLGNIKKTETTTELKPDLPLKQTSEIHKVSAVKQIPDPEEWSDIEEMHIFEESEDDYEDILPKHERLSSMDTENLWFPKPFSLLCSSPEHMPMPSLDDYWTLPSSHILEDLPLMDDDLYSGELIPLDYDDFEKNY